MSENIGATRSFQSNWMTSWVVVPLATAVFTVAWVLYKSTKRQSFETPRRRASFTSLGLALGSFPVESNVPEAIINAACYFKNNDLPSIDAIVCEIVQPLLEKYERLAMFLDVKTGFFHPTTEPYEPNDLIRTIGINCPDDSIVHKTIFAHHNDSLMQYNTTRPWWEILVVDNKGSGPSALVIRVHHTLADGLSLVHAFSPLLKKKESKISAGNSSQTSTNQQTGSIDQTAPSRNNKSFFSRMHSLIEGTIHVLTLGTTKYDHDTIFSKCNHPTMKYSGQRDYVILPTVPLSFIKQLKSAGNCTVNTIIMTAISQAIHEYCVSQNDPILVQSQVDKRATPDVRCRALLPVGFPRSPNEISNPQTALSNKWCMISCEMHIGHYDTILHRMRSIHSSMAQIKGSSRPIMQLCIQNLIVPFLPRTIARQAVMDVFSRHSLVLTNVPGHDDICELAGKAVTGVQLFFSNLLTQIDILSYANNVFGNIVYDPNTLPNFEHFGVLYAKALVKIAEELNIQPPDDLLLSISNAERP